MSELGVIVSDVVWIEGTVSEEDARWMYNAGEGRSRRAILERFPGRVWTEPPPILKFPERISEGVWSKYITR